MGQYYNTAGEKGTTNLKLYEKGNLIEKMHCPFLDRFGINKYFNYYKLCRCYGMKYLHNNYILKFITQHILNNQTSDEINQTI